MRNASNHPKLPPKPFKWFLLFSLFLLGVWFLAINLSDVVTRSRSDSLTVRDWVLLVHLTFATPLLLLPPWQFSRRVRMRWPLWHRRGGRLFLTSAAIAATGAIYLGLTFQPPAQRVPLVVFATVWLFFTAAAWFCALRRAFAAHELFVIRCYTIALAFVFVRVMGDAQGFLFSFIPDKEMIGITREWLSFVLPLLVVEGWCSWWPAIRSGKSKASGSHAVG